jgi:hypothetical protein
MFSKSPTFIGKAPVKEFYDKLSTSNWEEEQLLVMAPLRLFIEMFSFCKLLEFPKPDGM